MIGMKPYTSIAAVCLAILVVALSGCGPRGGLLIKPVPLDDRLKEATIASDPGLFVTDKVVIVDVDGLIMNERGGGWFAPGDNPVSLFVEKLDKAQSDPAVKALVLRINSPGGGVTASDIMHRRLCEFRTKRKVPVIAVLEDVAASGGYYLACGADRIVAHPTSVTGSIGVLVQTISFSGTMKMLGIHAKAVTTGKFKDMASPFKPLSDEDLAILQGIVDEFYERFLDVVAVGRPGMSVEKVRSLADGRVYTGSQAVNNGLADQLGYMDDAIELAKKAGRVGRAKIVMYHRPLGYRANVYSTAPGAPQPQVNVVNVNIPDALRLAQPQFLYLWTGRTP